MLRIFLLLCFPLVAYSQLLHEGVATHFQAIGYPYGACGVPEAILAEENSLDYVALNVFDSPGDYRAPGAFGNRPLMGADTVWLGTYDNGRNCGRWIEVELGDDCTVANGGEAGSPICGGGTGWVADGRNGAILKAIVTDQCSDNNAWCRDNPGHLDIHTPALNHFRFPSGDSIAPYAFFQGGAWITTNYNNRKVKWHFTSAPAGIGDIHIHYTQGSKPGWRRILVTNLPNGIHGVDQWVGLDVNGKDLWQKSQMEGDMGQMFILPRADLPDPQKIRVWDVNDSLLYGGRTYSISLPASCATECAGASIPVDYQASGGQDPTMPSPIKKPLPNGRAIYGVQASKYNLLGQMQSPQRAAD
jgi:hypothetical protein